MTKNLKVGIEFKPQDIWVGVFWKNTWNPSWVHPPPHFVRTDIWVCILPMLPIHIQWTREQKYG